MMATLVQRAERLNGLRPSRGIDPAVCELGLTAIYCVACRMPEFISDDVWRELGPSIDLFTDNRTLGSLMRRANVLGWITPTESYVPTTRESRHRSPVRVWRSLVNEG